MLVCLEKSSTASQSIVINIGVMVGEVIVFSVQRRSDQFDIQANVRYNLRAAVTAPVVLLAYAIIVFSRYSVTGSLVLCAFIVVCVMIPFCLLHIAAKPVVRLAGKDVVVVPSGGVARYEFRRPYGECRISAVGEREFSIAFFPWWADIVPAGMTPSRMIIVARKGDEDRWKQIAEESEESG